MKLLVPPSKNLLKYAMSTYLYYVKNITQVYSVITLKKISDKQENKLCTSEEILTGKLNITRIVIVRKLNVNYFSLR